MIRFCWGNSPSDSQMRVFGVVVVVVVVQGGVCDVGSWWSEEGAGRDKLGGVTSRRSRTGLILSALCPGWGLPRFPRAQKKKKEWKKKKTDKFSRWQAPIHHKAADEWVWFAGKPILWWLDKVCNIDKINKWKVQSEDIYYKKMCCLPDPAGSNDTLTWIYLEPDLVAPNLSVFGLSACCLPKIEREMTSCFGKSQANDIGVRSESESGVLAVFRCVPITFTHRCVK